MHTLQKLALSAALFASLTSPSLAFFDELVKGLTSVTNNLIDSTESVTNNTVNNASTTMVSLSGNPGKMADRIGVMADRIGFMADRIVTTEGIMAGLAHKIIDRTMEPRVAPHFASYAHPAPALMPTYYQANNYGNAHGSVYAQPQRPAQAQQISSNPYIATQVARQLLAHSQSSGNGNIYGNGNAHDHSQAQPDNSRYSASYMIFGNTGSTYTAAQPGRMPLSAPSNIYNYPAPATVTKTVNSCGYSFGLPRRSC